ncbi:hypothetical protein CAPTEDRAFT_186971 [Capitella teleta]|uniref:Uncharacterized protein n=1 Tax=Capitella teleta TaxID=283909 RepID=R7V4U0_CAPTE|nr:hypothetical protein CAPTEDRAFT_186971 [Capitella teleta]|eukprot:ELU13868.1 hypothetical protein CAPTEDRAFT_186971 [Capitella teleta]
MTYFWAIQKHDYLEYLKVGKEVEADHASKKVEEAAPINEKKTTKSAAADVSKEDDCDEGDEVSNEDDHTAPSHAPAKDVKQAVAGMSAAKKNESQNTTISNRFTADSNYDTDMDDDEIVREGKRLAKIRSTHAQR